MVDKVWPISEIDTQTYCGKLAMKNGGEHKDLRFKGRVIHHIAPKNHTEQGNRIRPYIWEWHRYWWWAGTLTCWAKLRHQTSYTHKENNNKSCTSTWDTEWRQDYINPDWWSNIIHLCVALWERLPASSLTSAHRSMLFPCTLHSPTTWLAVPRNHKHNALKQ